MTVAIRISELGWPPALAVLALSLVGTALAVALLVRIHNKRRGL